MKKIHFITACLILGLFLILLIVGNIRLYSVRQLGQNQLKDLGQEIEELEQEKQALQAKIEVVKWTDYLERIARENLNLRREKETVVAFPTSQEQDEEKPPAPPEEEKGLWQIFLDKLRD